jgi:RNA polymerase sigma-70 factor (ECF subfamily)
MVVEKGPSDPGVALVAESGIDSRVELDNWFAEAVLPHEYALTAFLRRKCGQPSDVADLRQEIYVKVYESARRERPRFVKAFMFAVARNLLIDRRRNSRVVQIDSVGDLSVLNVIGEEIPADRELSARQELAQLKRALDALPPRCRQVLVLRKIEGLSQREVAMQMGITQATVEKQLAKAVRGLADALGAPAGPAPSGERKPIRITRS